MKHERRITILTAAILAFTTAWGAVGCLASAFDLNLAHPGSIVLVLGLVSLFSGIILSFRRGGLILLGLILLSAVWIHRDGTAAEQLRQLIFRLATVYDRAYGWGVPQLSELPWNAGFADWPLAISGSAIALAVSHCMVRQRSSWPGVLLTLLPLSCCIVVTDTVPAEGWLLMVAAGLILLILTTDLRRESAYQGIRLVHAAILPVLLFLAALFLLVPQKDYVNHSEMLRENILLAARNIPKLVETGMSQAVSSLRSQPDRKVDLSNLGPRIPFTYPVMEVTAQKSGSLYLRQQDYDQYDGLGWTSSEGRSEAFPAMPGPEESIRIRTQNQKSCLFLPYHPAIDMTLESGYAENRDAAREYTIPHSCLPEDWRLRAYENTTGNSQQWQAYLSLPDATRREASAYLEHLDPANLSHTAKADIIAALVTDSARYDLSPEKMPASEPDFALWFLRDADRGYCVHFATAATVLLRAAGVPARYVTGYLLEAAAGESVTVTEENAHAWAEYYEPNLGLWLPLDATPTEEAPALLPTPLPVPSEPSAPTEAPAETSAQRTEVPTEATLSTEAVPPAPPEPAAKAPQPSFPAALLTLPALILVLMAQRSVRLALARRRRRTGSTNRQALARWQEALRLSRLLKESPTEELIHLAQKAKFSQHELTAEELLTFDSFNRSCLRRLKKKPWYLRLVHQFVYAAY